MHPCDNQNYPRSYRCNLPAHPEYFSDIAVQISNWFLINIYWTSHKLLMLWLRWIECHLHCLLWVMLFICLSPHGYRLSKFRLVFISDWVLFNNACFMLPLFHFAFCFITSTRNDKNLFCRKLMQMPCTNLQILYAQVIFASVN